MNKAPENPGQKDTFSTCHKKKSEFLAFDAEDGICFVKDKEKPTKILMG